MQSGSRSPREGVLRKGPHGLCACPLTVRRFPNEQPPGLSAGKVPAIPRLQGGAPAGSDSITQPPPSPRGGRGPGAGHPANSYGLQAPCVSGQLTSVWRRCPQRTKGLMIHCDSQGKSTSSLSLPCFPAGGRGCDGGLGNGNSGRLRHPSGPGMSPLACVLPQETRWQGAPHVPYLTQDEWPAYVNGLGSACIPALDYSRDSANLSKGEEKAEEMVRLSCKDRARGKRHGGIAGVPRWPTG